MEIDFPEVTRVSHSRAKTWRRCQMQHHYKYVQKLTPVRKARPLYLGSTVHEMLEVHLNGGDWNTVYKAAKAEYDKLFQEEQLLMGNIPEEAKQIVTRYLAYYEDDGLIYPKWRKRKATELKIHIEIGTNLEYIGYVDALPVDAEGRLWLMDHKTCKNIPGEEQRYSDLQMVFYYWALPLAGYKQPDGILWDYLRTKPPAIPEPLKKGGLSMAKNQDTTYDVYMEAVAALNPTPEEYDAYHKFASETFAHKEEKFFRRIYLPNPNRDMVNAVVQDLVVTAHEIQVRGREAKVRNMTRDCSWCPFYNLCQAEVRGLDTEYIRKTEFTQGVIDVEEENPDENNDE